MRSSRRAAGARWTILAAALWSAIVAGAGDVRASGTGDLSLTAIDAYLRSEMAASAIPGLAVAIVSDGRTIHLAAFGVAGPDGRPMTTRTPVVLGSVGKSITALAIRQLVDRGRIDLDAGIRRYLPWFTLAGTVAQTDAITIRSLLDHTSGLSTADGQDPRWYAPSLAPEDAARALASVRPAHPVGKYAYSNLNYLLLGVVVEAVSGQSYGTYVRDQILEPLGMSDTSTEPGARASEAIATGHRYIFGVPVAADEPFPGAMVPAGYQISTANDMSHFVAALTSRGTYGGTNLISGDRSPSVGPGLGTDWQPLATADPEAASGQSGSTLTTNADILVAPGHRLGVVILMNGNPTQLLGLPRGAADLARDVLRLSLGQVPDSTAPTVSAVYFVVDAVLAVLLVLLLAHVWRARSWSARLARSRHRRWFRARAVGEDVVLPLGVLIMVPLAIGLTGSSRAGDPLAGWTFLLWTLPDIGIALLILSGTALALGGLKLMASWR